MAGLTYCISPKEIMIEQKLYWCMIRDGSHIIALRQFIDQIDLEQVKIQWKIRYEWRQRHKKWRFSVVCVE